MASAWVKALRPLSRYTLEGKYQTYQSGDWFECNKQEMLELLARRLIETTASVLQRDFQAGDAGVLLLDKSRAPAHLDKYGIAMQHGERLALPWERTLILTSGTAVTAESAALGMLRISEDEAGLGWEMAAILSSAVGLAREVGTEEEQARTLELVGDLRLPVYDANLVWVRRTTATEEVIQLWSDELAAGTHPAHAFIRAIYQRPVALCTLPENWIGRWIRV